MGHDSRIGRFEQKCQQRPCWTFDFSLHLLHLHALGLGRLAREGFCIVSLPIFIYTAAACAKASGGGGGGQNAPASLWHPATTARERPDSPSYTCELRGFAWPALPARCCRAWTGQGNALTIRTFAHTCAANMYKMSIHEHALGQQPKHQPP